MKKETLTGRELARRGGSLFETNLEAIEDCADLGRKLREQWDNRLVLGRTNLIEHYRDGYLTLRLDFALFGFEPRQYTVVFNGHNFGDVYLRSGLEVDWGRKIELTDAGSYRCPRNDELAVLIGVVEIMKHPEGIALRGGPSVKRLVRTDELLGGGRDALYYSLSSGFVSIGCGEDRKAALISGRTFGVFDKLPNQEIEGGALVLQNLPNADADFWRDRFAISKDNGKPLKFGVVLGPNSLGVVLSKGLEDCLKIVDTFIGPFDLQSRAN